MAKRISLLSAADRAYLERSAKNVPIERPTNSPPFRLAVIPAGKNISIRQRPAPDKDPGVLKILSERQSRRAFVPLSIEQLNDVLFHACRVRSSWKAEGEFVASSRPAPSAGARHPIECVCLINNVEGVESGCWYFDPFALSLQRAKVPNSFLHHFNKLTSDVLHEKTRPPVVILFVAILEKTLSRYPQGMSLVWRDAGALAATIAMTAEALELAACPLGFSSKMIFPKSFGLTPTQAWVMGGIALGGRNRLK